MVVLRFPVMILLWRVLRLSCRRVFVIVGVGTQVSCAVATKASCAPADQADKDHETIQSICQQKTSLSRE